MKTKKYKAKEKDIKFENSLKAVRIDAEYPLIFARVGEERFALRAGKETTGEVEVIELIFDSHEDFITFWKDYKTSGFNYDSRDVVMLKRVLSAVPTEVYLKLKAIEPDYLIDYLIEYLGE